RLRREGGEPCLEGGDVATREPAVYEPTTVDRRADERDPVMLLCELAHDVCRAVRAAVVHDDPGRRPDCLRDERRREAAEVLLLVARRRDERIRESSRRRA